MRSRIWFIVAGVLVLAVSAVTAEPIRKTRDAIKGSYIIVLDPEVADVLGVAQELGQGRLKHVYQWALKGFAAELEESAAETLAEDPRVLYVAEDGMVSITETQPDATWGLDRIDQRDLPLDTIYSYTRSGAGVHVYGIDTGIRSTHIQFAGRMGPGFTAINDGYGTEDCHGHGTHTAGTIGSTVYGVAKGVIMHPVRVLSCAGSGTYSQVIAGVDWVTAQSIKPAVANMSLGGAFNSALNDAVTGSILSGVTYSVSAGNSNGDSCALSPASTPEALTVGATDSADTRAYFSSYGRCLDLYGPGVAITSTYNLSDTSTATMSGTSMSAPHVAGVAALYLEANPLATPFEVGQAILAAATADKMTDPGAGSPNLLLYSLFGDVPPPPPPPDPISNGGFEGSGDPWTFAGAASWHTGEFAHSGSGYAALGGSHGVVGEVSQVVTVPVDSAGVCTFWFFVDTGNKARCLGCAVDFLYLDVISDSVTKTIGTLSNRDRAELYQRATYSLQEFRGQTVALNFRVATSPTSKFILSDALNRGGPIRTTTFYVDDVSLR